MSRAKLFIQNFLVYGLGSIIGKIIPLIMLPIITSIMTDSKYYGINDMVNLVISFSGAIAMMGIYDAMFRMFFEKEEELYKKNICSTALFIVIISSTLVCLIMYMFKDDLLKLIIDDIKYNFLFFIIIFSTFLSGIGGIISAPTRMENKRKIFLITNTITPIFTYTIAILLLLKGEYIYALPLAAFSSSFIMVIVFFFLNRKWFSFKNISFKYIKILLQIGLPLMPTFLMYWICRSFDRVMIKEMLNLDELGLYSVASKIAQISQFIYTAFAMGWQYFAFSTMNDKDQKKLTSNVANYLLGISIIATIAVTTFSKIIFIILAKGSYSNTFVILPYLFISPLLLMIFQIIGNQFIVVKKTYQVPLILTFAVIVNVVCNYFFIPIIGIEGASIATMLGYIVAVLIAYIVTIKSKLLYREKRICISLLIFIIYLAIWRVFAVNNLILSIILSVICYLILFIVYKPEVNLLISKLKID